MIAPLREFQAVLLSAASEAREVSLGDPLLRRFQAAIQSLANRPDEVGPSDIAGLLRQAILRNHLALGEDSVLRVPKEPGWPTRQDWQEFACDAEMAGTQHFLVRPQPWSPAWLDENAPSMVEAAIQELVRRPSRLVPGDPLVFELAGIPDYVTPGQRAAVQAAFLFASGFNGDHRPAYGRRENPRIPIARPGGLEPGWFDACRRPDGGFGERPGGPVSFSWPDYGMPRTRNVGVLWPITAALTRMQSEEFGLAIRDGSVPIVFASPEAIMGPLRGPLFDAARQGRLKLFAVDEAHVIAQWGQEFRPEFQSIAGLRDALLDACPTRRAVSNPFDDGDSYSDCYETLQFLFGRGNCQLISELSLRPEPGFLLSLAAHEPERIARIMGRDQVSSATSYPLYHSARSGG